MDPVVKKAIIIVGIILAVILVVVSISAITSSTASAKDGGLSNSLNDNATIPQTSLPQAAPLPLTTTIPIIAQSAPIVTPLAQSPLNTIYGYTNPIVSSGTSVQPATPTITTASPIATPAPIVTSAPIAPIPLPASQPAQTIPSAQVVQPAPAPVQLVPLPLWCKQSTLVGIYTDSAKDVKAPLALSGFQATATTQNIQIQGMCDYTGQQIPFAGVLEGQQFTFSQPNNIAGLKMAVQWNAKGDQVTAVYNTITLRVNTSQSTNAFQISPQMTCIFIHNCRRYQSDILIAAVIDSDIAMYGKDDFGSYVIQGTGQVTPQTTTLALNKRYTDASNSFQYTGTVSNGVIGGQWEEVNNPSNGSEFRMIPKGVVLNEDIPLYGAGCQYPSDWQGYLLYEGTELPVQMTSFTVNGSKITADLSDKWGASKFQADIIGRNFKGTKTYPSGSVIQQTGTISIQRIQGQWIGNAGSGTFYYTPK